LDITEDDLADEIRELSDRFDEKTFCLFDIAAILLTLEIEFSEVRSLS
jgi:hypothetical protein